MIQAYTTNQSVTTGNNITFNNIAVQTGCVATLAPIGSSYASGDTIYLNRPGIYMVEFNAYGAPTAAGAVSAQLVKDGTAVPYAVANTYADAGENASISFTTLVRVGMCPCAGSKALQVIYEGAAGTLNLANITVTKIR